MSRVTEIGPKYRLLCRLTQFRAEIQELTDWWVGKGQNHECSPNRLTNPKADTTTKTVEQTGEE